MVRLFFAGLFWPVVLPLVLTGKRPEPQQHQHPQGVQVPPWVQAMHARHAELDGDDLIGDLPPRTLDRRNPHL